MQPRVLSPVQVTRLLDAPDLRGKWGRRDRAFLSLMALGGLRIAEACSLQRSDVDTTDTITRITFVGKGQKRRTVTLPRVAADALHATLKDFPGPHVFYSGHGRPLTPRSGRWVAQGYFDACGFEAWVHPHSLRHTCATTILRATKGDMRMVQRVLGHSSPLTTSTYYDGWNSLDGDRAASALNEVFGG